MNNNFDKVFSLDTNIILDNAMNLVTLSDKGRNLIVLPETVLDEIDSKKSGFAEINFQAREFARLLFDAEILEKKEYNDITVIVTAIDDVTIYIISKEVYKADTDKVSGSIKNDRKILEITKDLQNINEYSNLKFISLDVMARTRAISIGIPTEPLNLGTKDTELDFITDISMGQGEFVNDGDDIIAYNPDHKPNNFNYVFDEMGQKKLACIQNGKVKLLQEKALRKQNVNPMNTEQLFFSNALLDNYYNIIVAEAKAGCSLPGSNVSIELPHVWISKEELSELIDITELPYIRKKGWIKFRKKTNKIFEYDKNSIQYNLLKMLVSKDRSNDIKTLNMDENYSNKYCKLSYWLGFTNFDYAIKKVRSIRKYSKFFEDPIIDNFTNYNPSNFKKTIMDIQSQFIQLEKNINLLEDLICYSNNILTLDYWFFRGWSEEEARKRIEDIQKNNSKEYWLKRKENPERYSDIQSNQIGYWTKQGYTLEEAKLKVKERQTTFSLEKCIAKYGKEEGVKKFNERQQKWQETLNGKSQEELDNINRRKMVSLTKASKSSLKVFNKVIEELNLKEYFLGIENNKEFFISEKESDICFYDFTLLKEKKIIEFNGCIWHPKEGQTDWKSIHGGITYEEALFRDKEKIEMAKRHGFDVLVIWDDETIENNIKKCIEFIKGVK